MASYTKWYRNGTISATRNSPDVTGKNTYWKTAGLNPGDIVMIGGLMFELGAVVDDTHITLATNYTGATVSNVEYAIIRNFTATSSAKVAAVGTELLGKVERAIDLDMQTIQGQSAYEVAKEEGFTGSKSAWLESLKAAGDWSSLNTRVASVESRLDRHLQGLHKFLYRYQNFGNTVTPEQFEAIRSGTFEGLELGGRWFHGSAGFEIIDYDYFYGYKSSGNFGANNQHHIVLRSRLLGVKYKADGDVSGAYFNSDVRKTLIPQFIEEHVIPMFGEEHLYKHGDFIPSAFDPTTRKHTAWEVVTDSCVEVPSWTMLMPWNNLDNGAFNEPEQVYAEHPSLSHGLFAICQYRPDFGNWSTVRECYSRSHVMQLINGGFISHIAASASQDIDLYITIC